MARGLIPEAAAGGILTIDLDALVANWQALAARAAPAECAAVVKADAYGTGIPTTVRALARAGCRTFFVALLEEGVRAREAAPEATIHVLNGLMPGAAPLYATHRLTPVLGSLPEIEEWAAFARAEGIGIAPSLHVDTGMNRLGLRPAEALALAARPGGIGVPVGILMSHFVASEEPADPLNPIQVETFGRLAEVIPAAARSLCNSSGIFLDLRDRFNLVRPGYALYGGNPVPGRPNPMRPVVRLDGRIVQVRDVEAGESVGYNAQWRARRPSRIAVVSIGYADGLLRSAGGPDGKRGADAIVRGTRVPLVGRVSMDLVTLDVTDVEGPVGRGDLATFLGEGIGVDDLAERAGTNGYEILTSLGRRYRRIHLGG